MKRLFPCENTGKLSLEVNSVVTGVLFALTQLMVSACMRIFSKISCMMYINKFKQWTCNMEYCHTNGNTHLHTLSIYAFMFTLLSQMKTVSYTIHCHTHRKKTKLVISYSNWKLNLCVKFTNILCKKNGTPTIIQYNGMWMWWQGTRTYASNLLHAYEWTNLDA